MTSNITLRDFSWETNVLVNTCQNCLIYEHEIKKSDTHLMTVNRCTTIKYKKKLQYTIRIHFYNLSIIYTHYIYVVITLFDVQSVEDQTRSFWLHILNLDYTFTDTLLQLLEEYISEETVEALNKLSLVGNAEQLKQSVHIANKLRESFAAIQQIVPEESSDKLSGSLRNEQIQQVQQVQSALSTLQELVLEHAPELETAINDQELQRVVELATRLNEDLSAVVAVAQVTVQTADTVNTESMTDNKSPVMAGLEEKIVALDETNTLENERVPEEQATESIVEPVPSSAAKSEKVIILEAESQPKQVASFVSDQLVSVDTAVVEIQQMEDVAPSAAFNGNFVLYKDRFTLTELRHSVKIRITL